MSRVLNKLGDRMLGRLVPKVAAAAESACWAEYNDYTCRNRYCCWNSETNVTNCSPWQAGC